jgi:hypothetical protein
MFLHVLFFKTTVPHKKKRLSFSFVLKMELLRKGVSGKQDNRRQEKFSQKKTLLTGLV